MLSQSSVSPKFRGLLIRLLQVGLILVLVGAGWLIYRQLPDGGANVSSNQGTSTLQIFIRQTPETVGPALDVAVSLYPVDIVAVRHEFFTEQRPGKRFEDFLKERMKGRSPINARLDKQGQGAVTLAPGSWWLHATLSGDEQLEWRLPVTVTGSKQVIELTPKNAYTRSRSF
ncbi:MAG TPA: hypothetical protein VFT44_00510 [Pyrinomonadaceae bacterium]|jgi:hypothetical protein|nr:hypothetical protein [Pyrinomonadaceae bacterium]